LGAGHAPPNVLLVAADEADRLVGYTGVRRCWLALAHDALRAAGCTEAFLFTHEHNERALAVYVTAGYRPDGSSRKSEFHSTRCASCGW
jgi:hypothetical protein